MALTNKEKRQQLVKQSFIEATKETIIKDGVGNVSARKVAEKVGYSYATIYNHFKDLNELLCAVKYEMTLDIGKYMLSSHPEVVRNVDDIKAINRRHINYFLDNRNVFEFFYNYKINAFDGEPIYLDDLEKMWSQQYACFVKKGRISADEVAIVAKSLIYALNGILAILASNHQLEAEDLCQDLDQIADFLLG